MMEHILHDLNHRGANGAEVPINALTSSALKCFEAPNSKLESYTTRTPFNMLSSLKVHEN